MAGRTPSQTVGPFFHEAMRWPGGERIVAAGAGAAVVLAGRVLDGAADAVGDAMIEAWQAGATGIARVLTAPDGSFRLETAMPAGDTPCIEVLVFARGLLKPLRTRAYLAPLARVRSDPALAALRDSDRLATLVATPAGERAWRWDVRLQGAGETVFFAR